MRNVLLIQAALAVLLVSGCAKRPATTQVSTPAPSGAGGTTAIRAEPTTPAVAPAPAAPAVTAATARPAPKDFRASGDLGDVHFDFDRYEIRPTDVKILDANAAWLRDNAKHTVLIEGHCDERGTNEYNTVLGERRARAAMNYLVSQGVRANRIAIISYSEERPVCTGHSETCWARNRRAHFRVRAE